MHLKFPLIFLIFLLLTSCAFPGSSAPTPTTDVNSIVTAAAATAFFRLTQVSAQFSATPSATLTETDVPQPSAVVLPTSIPTIVPIPGVIRANVNVRGIPQKSKAYDIGGLLLGQPVKVIGRNDAATWLYILYADSPTGTGWVLANAVTLSAELGILPILIYPNGIDATPIMIPPFIYAITGTPQPPSTPPDGWSKFGTLTQAANVRIGPSVGFLTIGILNPGQKVTFRGRTDGNTWVQIDYPSGPDGHGWILSSLLQINDGYGGLPVYDDLGTPVTPTPQGQPATQASDSSNGATDTLTPSPTDNTGVAAEVTNQINVRSGPVQADSSYGMLNPKDKVSVTGITFNKYWYQIKYASSPNGFGWVASQYVRVLGDMRNLPYFNNLGTPAP